VTRPLTVLKRALPFVLAVGIWLTPVPAGLTPPAWHLFAVFASAIASVLIGSFPLLPSALLAVAAVVLTGTISPAKAFAGFANLSVLLVVIAFLVAIAVVKSDLGRRISLLMVSLFGQSSIGLAYSIVITDALIAPGFPSNTARGGVLFPIVLSVATGSGSRPDDPKGRRLGGYLMFCGIQPSPSSAVPPAPSPISTLRTNPPTTPLKTPACGSCGCSPQSAHYRSTRTRRAPVGGTEDDHDSEYPRSAAATGRYRNRKHSACSGRSRFSSTRSPRCSSRPTPTTCWGT